MRGRKFAVWRKHQLAVRMPDLFYEPIDSCQPRGMFIYAADIDGTNTSGIFFDYVPIDFRISFTTVANQHEGQIRE